MIGARITWVEIGQGDLHGTGEHATYVVHQLIERPTGEPERKGKFITFRRLGATPLKAVGGPYDTVQDAQAKAESMEATL